MAVKNPRAPQANATPSGKRPYAQSAGGYMDKMSRVTDRAMEYMLKEFNAFLVHSENKKPYKSTTYEDMEYGFDPIGFDPWHPPYIPLPNFPAPPPTPYTPTPEDPGPPDPGPTPTPTPGPTPGPPPAPGPSPSPGPIYLGPFWCEIPDFEFCPNGGPVMVPIGGSDPVTQVHPWSTEPSHIGLAGSNAVIVTPQGGSNFISFCLSTKHGAYCCGGGHAKDPDLCKGCDGTGSIGYTTTGMGVGETQQLTATCGQGPGAPCQATWGIASGGGSISSTGLYTAPASNASCSNNPIITLACGGTVVATLALAINGAGGGAAAYSQDALCTLYTTECCEHSTGEYGQCWWGNHKHYGCDGVVTYDSGCTYTFYFVFTGCSFANKCQCGGSTFNGNIIDTRTGAQLAAGCCPAALL